MKNAYSLLIALFVGAASLSSCSRSNYAFNPNTPAYLGSEKVHAVATPAQPAAVAKAADVAVAPAPAATPATPSKAEVATAITEVQAATPAAKSGKVSLAQRILIKKVTKQLAKVQEARKNTAHAEHTASKTGRAAIITLVGLLLILLGAAIGNGFGGLLVIIGIIAFLVGLVLIVVHLVSGD